LLSINVAPNASVLAIITNGQANISAYNRIAFLFNRVYI
jgi:hypothetical protein